MTKLEKFERVNQALTEFELQSLLIEVLRGCTTEEFTGLIDPEDATINKQLLNYQLFVGGTVGYKALTTAFGIRTHAIYLRYHKPKN